MSKLFQTQDGSHSIFSEQFGVSYHSKYGAIQETQHVFIDAALRYKALLQKEISILDIGFGTGLNAYMTLLEAIDKGLSIDYTSYEAFPISLSQAQLLNYPTLLSVPHLAEPFLTLHKSAWNEVIAIHQNFRFQKCLQNFETINAQAAYDIIYFDAFAPNAQPELWEAPLLTQMYAALKQGGVLVTYCAKGVVKRTLKAVGFQIEALKGPPGKREMTRAIKEKKSEVRPKNKFFCQK